MAQYNVTAITTGSVVDEADSIINSVTYLNQTLPVTSVTAGTQTWVVGSLDNTISIRRSGAAGLASNRQVVYSERETFANPLTLRIPTPTTTEALLNGNNMYGGTDNLFINAVQGDGNYSDVERVDFVSSAGFSASSSQALAVFERGTTTSHDGFKIAAITGVDGSGNPTSFGSLVQISTGWGPTPLRTVANPGYGVLNNSLGLFAKTRDINSQNIGGVVITLDHLVTAGTTVYGYSLFGSDVEDNGDTNNLIDFTNNTYFPQESPESVQEGGNGIDLSTINLGIITSPDAVNDAYTTAEDTSLTIPASGVLGNDTDPEGDTLTVTAFTQPTNGTVTIGSDGQLQYTPNANFNGVDTLNYTISDGNGGTDTATVTITVTGVNDAPTPVSDSYSTRVNRPMTQSPTGVVYNVLSNDTDIDGDTLTVTRTQQPTNGTVVLNADGTIKYTPNVNFTGLDSFRYTVSDGNGGTARATVTVNVSSGPSLDVRPGQNPSNVNLTSGGTLSVGLLSTATSNTTQVLPSSIRLDDNRDSLMSGGGVAPISSVRSDVNSDGRADLLLTFNMSDVASVVGVGQNIFVYGTNNGTQLIAANPNSDPVIVTAVP